MTLQATLEKISQQTAKEIPDDALDIMNEKTNSVTESMEDRDIPEPGDSLPEFELPNSHGQVVRSAELAQSGTFILTLFRGKW